MNRATIVIALAALAGCPDDRVNPPQFWIATNGSELMLRLAPVEPIPF